MKREDYLERILRARVYDVAIESPLELAPALSRRLGNRLLLKREDLQSVFSFKLRGAYNKMVNLPPQKLARGVIAASAGNHAQGVALAAQKLGCRATIVMPVTTPRIKVDAVAARGARVVLHGDSYDEAYAHALKLKRRLGLSFVHPYDDPEVIAGQGTIGMEILRQSTRPIDAVFVPVGGGGLISGIAAYLKHLRPGHQGDRRGAHRRRRHGALAEGGPAREARARGTVRRRRRREACRQGDLSPVPAPRRRDGAGGYRRNLRGDQGRVRGHPRGARARGRAGDRRRQGLGGAPRRTRQEARRRGERRQHQLRPPALRRRARRSGRAPRGGARSHHSGGARQLPAFLPRRGRSQHHRVQLPHVGSARGAHLRRRHGARPRRDAAHRAAACAARAFARSTCPRTKWRRATCAT